jgi:hypothetical protein
MWTSKDSESDRADYGSGNLDLNANPYIQGAVLGLAGSYPRSSLGKLAGSLRRAKPLLNLQAVIHSEPDILA